ncbi:MAG: choline/ethanolamine kinase family protein [Kiloniellaceae bacterium]
MDDNVLSALDRIPLFEGEPRERIACQRLGGLTNLVYKVEVGGARYVLRIPGEGTETYIDREVEAHNARIAAEAGVSAELLFFDRADGLMLTRYLDGCATMSPELFKSRPGAPARAAAVLKRMHTCGKPFKFRFELFDMIDDYLGVLAKTEAPLPDGYRDVVKEAEAVRGLLAANPIPLAPCHCDPLAENFLDDGERMWVVDWEYSGMNDPIWDLGDVSVEAAFGEDEDQEMMEAYCGGRPAPAVFGRMVIYKAMCDLLWTLWGLIQFANKNPADDFWAYSVNRFERCKALMGREDFGRHLDAVGQGAGLNA